MADRKSSQDFLAKLKSEAQLQADLATDSLLPESFGAIGALVFNYSLPVLLISSFLLALLTVSLIH